MSFSTRIHEIGDSISFAAIRNVAKSIIDGIPPIEQDKLYEELARGIQILDDDQHLNMYLRSFGPMHKAKAEEAFKNIPHINSLFAQKIEIFDWGCGQGTATICLLDYLRSNNIEHNIKRINLIDPSLHAVDRAVDILSCYKECKEVEIRSVVKCFDDLKQTDIEGYNCRKLHLFSNILDVASFDLAQFTRLFQQTQKGGNYIISVGPLNAGYKRADWFIDAINPNHTNEFVRTDFPKGCWISGKDWTISLRILAVFIENAEDVAIIRQRIVKSQQHRQMFAGFVTDAVSDALAKYEFYEQAENLMASLSSFDVRSNKSLEHPENINPLLAVISNIISRGMPTKASLLVEKNLAAHYGYSITPSSNEYYYRGSDRCNAKDIFHALHVIDPRFSVADYNGKILESSFESEFVTHYLPQHDKSYMCQLLEPQRNLSSIVKVPNRKFPKDCRVDFALEVPYSTKNDNNHIGFVVEVNGAQYHSSVINRIKDSRREAMITAQGWDVNTLTSIGDSEHLVNGWENDSKFASYLQVLKDNYGKKLEGDWRDLIQFTLSPFAVARVEKMLVEAMISGYLDVSAPEWKIAVIERDVPCAQMAIDDLRQLYDNLCKLKGSSEHLPNIQLTIISSQEFYDSPLHQTNRPRVKQQDSNNYDLCIDISMLLRDKIANLPISLHANTYYVVRSSYYSQEVRTIYSAENIRYAPLVNKTARGEYPWIPGRKSIIEYFLQNIFRKHEFREGQPAILSRVLSDQTTIGLLPTGGGKSLTYQLAAMLQPGVTIIVDPLISLMVDQYDGLMEQRIDASACINSTMTMEEKSYCLGRMQNGELQFMFLSPERFMMNDFREEVLAMPRNNHVFFAYGVIDEVHTVSEWGHDFRPAYLQLGRNMTRFLKTKNGNNISIIGLTATASYDVLADVERELTLGGNMRMEGDAIINPDISERDELTYRIVKVKADFSRLKLNNPYVINTDLWGLRGCVAESKKTYMRELLDKIPSEIDSVNKEGDNNVPKHESHIENFIPQLFYVPDSQKHYRNAGIVFCPYREGSLGVEDKITQFNVYPGIASFISELRESYHVGKFIGGDEPALMGPFLKDEQNIMVATKAFGMGIDKQNVRFTINITHPSSIESYVQEAGRAGRDKKTAICYLLYEPTELVQLSVENMADAFGDNMPNAWNPIFNLYKDQYVEWEDLHPLCNHYRIGDIDLQQMEYALKPFIMNVDKDIQLYFHNSSFKGAYKEKVILTDLAYGITNVNNQSQNNELGVFSAMNGLHDDEYSKVIVSGENHYKTNYLDFCKILIQKANEIATPRKWETLSADAFAGGGLTKIKSFRELLVEISKITGEDYWRRHYRAKFMEPLHKAFCQRRENEDTDKAIYRMCCIGLIDDVEINYLNGGDVHEYTLRVRKLPEGGYYNCLCSFFEKYYSTQQANQLVTAAMNYGKATEINNCLGYLVDFVYDKLEGKRKRSIEEIREACVGGIEHGDSWLKEFIHLYFNSKYAKDEHLVDGENYSLRMDIKNPDLSLIVKYINVVSVDPSGPVVNNVKHLYGAVLRILKDELTDDNLGTPILYMLRAYCLSFLGLGDKNASLFDEFKTSYWDNGIKKIIENQDHLTPFVLWNFIENEYNQTILKDLNDSMIESYLKQKRIEMALMIGLKSYKSFTDKYTN